MDVRCKHKKHGELNAGLFEVKCSSRWCGANADNVVIHKFNPETGALVETKQYKNPRKKGKPNGI